MKRPGLKAHQLLTGEEEENYGNKKNPSRRGRNDVLIAQRNTDIIYRYYYYNRIHKMRYEGTIDMLHVEFRLSKITIGKIITANSDECRKVFEKKLTVKQLDDKFPLLKWRVYKKGADEIKQGHKQSFILK